jgi:hypothetical protein
MLLNYGDLKLLRAGKTFQLKKPTDNEVQELFNSDKVDRQESRYEDLERIDIFQRKQKLSSTDIGTIGEYYVMIDLIARGYKVQRTANIVGEADIRATSNHETLKIEVKHSHDVNRYIHRLKSEKHSFDVMAIVYKSEIRYYKWKDK